MKECTLPLISDPMNMFISVRNNGTEGKVFNVLTGGTGVAEVEDNFQVGDLKVLSDIQTGSSTITANVSYSIIDYNTNRLFVLSTFGDSSLLVTDLETKQYVGSVSLPNTTGGGIITQYYHNGFIYVISNQVSPNKGVYVVDCITLNFYFIAVPGIGELRYGSMDAANNKFYFCAFTDQKLWFINTADQSNPATLGTSITMGVNVDYCCVGDTTILVTSSASNQKKIVNKATSGITTIAGMSNFLESRYSNGLYVTCGSVQMAFVDESALTASYISFPTFGWGITPQIRDDRYYYIGISPLLTSVAQIDMVLKSASAIPVSVSGGAYGAQLNYNPITDRVQFATPTTAYSLDPVSQLISSVDIPSAGFGNVGVNGFIPSLESGLSYIPQRGSLPAGDIIYELSQMDSPVTITYNGGANTVEYMNNSLVAMPIKVLRMQIQSSSREELLNLLTKFRKDSTGPLKSFQIENAVKFNAENQQHLVEFSGDELEDPIFDATTYMQGTINAMSSLGISLDYVEYNASIAMAGNCEEDLEPIIAKKKVCIFYNRKFF